MDEDKYLKFYSRPEVQQRILEVSEDREISPRYDKGFGRRPDIVEYPGDILELAKKGATSFHISEERWDRPLRLKPGMIKKDLDENRKGWDLVLDIDTKFWIYAKWCAYYLIEALKFHDVKNIFVKFSGNKGFHIAVPFESFPKEVNGEPISNLFPQAPRVIAGYLQDMITDIFRDKVLECEDIQSLVEKTDMKREELMKDGKLDPFVIVDIDTVLLSYRHLFRAPYSLHEKSGLVSVPIDMDKVLSFEKEFAQIEKVDYTRSFLDRESNHGDARGLIIQAFDWWGKKNRKQGPDVEKKERVYSLPEKAIEDKCFPGCIEKLLEGNLEDGKKRALFILVNFLRHMGWPFEDVQAKIKEWNAKNPSPLSESYVLGQLNWAKRQKEPILPPNCSNKAYYQDMRIKCSEQICSRSRNPVNRAVWLNKLAESQAKKVKKKAAKKKVVKKKEGTESVEKEEVKEPVEKEEVKEPAKKDNVSEEK
jgi:hypothetical protein